MVKLVDLSQEIYEGMPVYPSHQRTAIFVVKTHEEMKIAHKTKYTTASYGILISDHGPTHVDSHNHVNPSPDAESIDELPLELFYTSAVCLDVSYIQNQDDIITKDRVEEALTKAGLELRKGDTVFFYTGHYNRNYHNPEKWLWIYGGVDREAMEWMADQGVVNVGADAPSIDSSKEMKLREYPAHMVCLERKVLNTENLANLDKVAGKRFTLAMFPLKIRKATASPVRAVAILDE